MNTAKTEKSTQNYCSPVMLVNTCVKCFGLALLTLLANGSAWAICEAEANRSHDEYKIASVKYNLNYNEQRVRQDLVNEIERAKGLSKEDLVRALENQEKSAALQRGAVNHAQVALEVFRACYYRKLITEKTVPPAVNSSGNSQNSQQNQPTQQQSQQAQQQVQQAQDAARVSQARADQARQGQRRRHEPENEASQCIQPDFGGLFGGMKNTCDFKVWYTYCGYRPKENSWLTGMNCEKQSFGSDSVGPGRTSASHTKGVESIHWIACKEPAWTVDTEFVPGQGIKGRCHTVGGK